MKHATFSLRLIALAATFGFAVAALTWTPWSVEATVPGVFQQVDCEGGGWFEQVIPHPSGRLYGRTDVGGMYRSDDHGDTWRFLSGDLPYNACYYVQGVAVAAGNADVVYQAVGTSYAASDPGRGVWKSVNGGASWTQVLANVNFSGNDDQHFGGECLAIEPGNDSEIWAGTRGQGLWRSTDAGAHWASVSPSVFTSSVLVAGITIHPSAPDTIWVCGDGGVWVSTDHGTNWTQKISATRIYKVVVKADGTAFAAGTNGGNVLYRFSVGSSVTNLYGNYTAPLPYAPGSDLAMTQLLVDGTLWAADLFNFTERSTDNGNTFTNMPMTLAGTLPGWIPSGTRTVTGGRNGLIQDPTSASRLFLGGGYSPFRSTDSGATWSYMNKGIGETVAYRATFHPTDANRVWLGLADLGCTTVSDAGASGVSSGYIAPRFPYPDDNVMYTHRVLVSAGKVIAPGGEQAHQQARVYQSTDNGVSWTKLAAAGLPTTSYGREIIEDVASADNADDFLVFTGGAFSSSEGGIYRTTDGGATFTRSTGLPTSYDPGTEFFWNVSLERDATDNTVRYALLRNSGFWKSTNRGASWTMPSTQPVGTYGRLRVDPVTGRVWVGYSFGLSYSADKGTTWTVVSGLTTVTELDAYNGRIVVIGQRSGDTADHVYVSADNGVTWDEITRSGLRFANAQAVTVDPWRAGTLWVSTGGRAISIFRPWAAFGTWLTTYFGSPSATGTAALTADADNDGVTTLAEYGFGTNPLVTETTRPWQVSKVSNRLTISFPRNTTASDLTMAVQGADSAAGPWTDLARSTNGAAFTSLVTGATVSETGTGTTRSVTASDLYTVGDAAHPRRFLRVSFTLP